MRNFTRFLLLLLVICMTASLLLACKNEKPPENTSPQSTTPPPSDDGLPEEALEYMPEAQDLNNYEYRMLIGCADGSKSAQYYYSVDGLSGDAVSQAFYERNAYVESIYNCVITPVHSTAGAGERNCYWIQPYLDSDEDLWDIMLIVAGDIMQKNVSRGDVINLADIDTLNLEASYWDQTIQNDYSIDGMIFALEGDYTIGDELSTQAVFYNGKIYEEWNYHNTHGSPYSMVEEGRWTYHTMLEMFKDTSKKSNGETLTEDDVWGMFTHYQSVHVFFMGSGLKTITVRDNETVVLTDDTTAFNNIFDVTYDILDTIFVNQDEVLNNNSVLGKSVLKTTDPNTMFINDKALFTQGAVSRGLSFRDMNSPFGILPIPMYYEGQGEYYCWTGTDHMPLTVPKTVVTHDHLEPTMLLTEVLCYYSRYAPAGALSLYDAFYEKMTVAKLCRTSEDYKMMELIYYSKCYDIDSVAAFSRLSALTRYLVEGVKTVYYGPNATGSSGPYVLSPNFVTLRSNMQSLRNVVHETIDVYLNSVHQNIIVPE